MTETIELVPLMQALPSDLGVYRDSFAPVHRRHLALGGYLEQR